MRRDRGRPRQHCQRPIHFRVELFVSILSPVIRCSISRGESDFRGASPVSRRQAVATLRTSPISFGTGVRRGVTRQQKARCTHLAHTFDDWKTRLIYHPARNSEIRLKPRALGEVSRHPDQAPRGTNPPKSHPYRQRAIANCISSADRGPQWTSKVIQRLSICLV